MEETHNEKVREGKGLGRLSSVDERDRLHLMGAVLPKRVELPESKIWYAPKPLDQGDTSTCVGHGWKHFLMSSPLCTKTGPTAYQIYDECTQVDEWPQNDRDDSRQWGTSVRAGAKALQARGHLSEYLWAFDETVMRRFVLLRGPVVVGVDWYEGAYETDSKGFIQLTGRVMGGHAFLVCGYSTRQKAYRALNSWGEGYGQRGRFWIRREDMQTLIAAGGEACSALEVALV